MEIVFHFLICAYFELEVFRQLFYDKSVQLDHRAVIYVAALPLLSSTCFHLLPDSLSVCILLLLGQIARPHLTPKQLSTEGKAVLITGCDSGFGRYFAKNLASSGFHVFAGCLDSSGEGAQELALYGDNLRESQGGGIGDGGGGGGGEGGGGITVLQLDITSPQQVEQCVAQVREAVRASALTFWALVNNAAEWSVSEVEFTPLTEMRYMLEVNLLGTMRVTQAFLPLVRDGRGRLVFLSSVAGVLPTPPAGAYAISKRGLECLVDLLRIEMRKWRVDVVNIKPCAFDTGAQSSARCSVAWARLVSNINKDVWQTYGMEYVKQVFRNGTTAPKQTDLGIVCQSLTQALVAVKPCITYPCGSLARTLLTVYQHLPDSWRDLYILKIQNGDKTVIPLALMTDNKT